MSATGSGTNLTNVGLCQYVYMPVPWAFQTRTRSRTS